MGLVTENAAAGGAEIRVGLIGYGLAGEAFHAPLIAATPGMRLAAIVTSNAERVRQARAGHPGATIVESAERLWERAGELDLVVVASPNRTHVPLAGAALRAGLPVVVDKPFAPAADEGRALVEEARRLGLLLTVFQNRRWDGDFLTLRRLMAEGALGDVHRFESRFERWRPVPKEGWREQGDPAEAGGILYDLGSHLIDQALVLFGPVTHVYAEVDRRRPGARVDDDAFVALTHASGARSHLWMSAVAGDHALRMRVLGSRAAYVKSGMDVQEAALRDGAVPGPGWGEEPEADWGRLGAADAWAPVRTEPGAYPAFYAAVADALRTGGPPPVDPMDSVAGLEIIHAARRSAAEETVVPLRTAQ
ncbi:MAG TPA: Gfo/Idh/MocA family oxidoreductase [Longimicrobium sp.]|jgi:predicted dehydrogenase|uniref:Gfo/Idh/MocA family protein n=1 Tax=Longimicrobium sp. TaxID=2029185 RepID=UPI002EDAA142